ncbi:MAG: hypothetical protein HOP18_18170 [Deltaproteobacteria bacterium]|nr:hypothetical protein [Deltaproteobacteria bacterium]
MSRGWGSYYFERFPPSRPRAAKGGIKAQSKRGSFGESWWAKRWIGVLESFQLGARLGRGRSYARSGQVLNITIEKGVVTAQVQGSRPTPYKVTIKLKALQKAEWQNLATVLAQQAIFTAKLLAGEMPQDIETAFREAGLALFPAKQQDLETDCSCPDWSNPCKHIAAVYYLLGEEFDRDPFVLFKLRGMAREEFIPLLVHGERQDKKDGKKGKAATRPVPVKAPTLPPEPLTTDVAAFWGRGPVSEDMWGAVRTPTTPAAVVKRLGNFPFWRGEEKFLSAIEPLYVNASARGEEVMLGSLNSETTVRAGKEGGTR